MLNQIIFIINEDSCVKGEAKTKIFQNTKLKYIKIFDVFISQTKNFFQEIKKLAILKITLYQTTIK